MGVVLAPVAVVGVLFCALGARLARSAVRSGGPEGWLASFFLGAGIAMPGRVIVTTAPGLAADTRVYGSLVLHALLSLALCAFTVFVVRVFRNTSWGAWALSAGLVGLLLLGPLLLIFVGAHRGEEHPMALWVGGLRALPFGWGLFESLRYHLAMRRRLALGLAEPVVTNRFLLFALWNGALFALMTLVVGLRAWALVAVEGGMLAEGDATARLIVSLLRVVMLAAGLTISASLWLSFFPPAAWLRRLEAGAATGDTPA